MKALNSKYLAAMAACAALLAGCTTGGSPSPSAGGSSSGAGADQTAACGSPIETGPLPDWADAGFSGDSSVPHVFGRNGDIVAVLFSHPLAQPRPEGSSNKILWVSRTAPTFGDTLKISAKLDGSSTQVTREVQGGPGPSIIDVPQAGCWHLELTWSGRIDTMDLVYAG